MRKTLLAITFACVSLTSAASPIKLFNASKQSFIQNHHQLQSNWSQFRHDRTYEIFFCEQDELVNSSGRVVVEFTFDSECKNALEQINQQPLADTKLFCKDSKVFNTFGRYIADATFDNKCNRIVKDLVQRGQPVAVVCVDGKMFNGFGDFINDLTFQNSCTRALKTLYVPHLRAREGLICADGKLYSTNSNLIEDLTFQSSCEQKLRRIAEDRPQTHR